MRARSLVQLFSVAVIVTVGVVWMKSRTTAVDLQTRLSALTTVRRNAVRALEQERDRLRSALAEAHSRRPADVAATSPVPAAPAPPRAVEPVLALGEWRSSREWRNEGQSTARHAVATLLWAAAGGDVGAMMRLIAFDDAGRKQAQALFDTLTPTEREAFSTPEALVAGLTIQAVPNNAAQLSWFHQRDADHATVGVFVAAPAQSAPTEIRAAVAEDNNPPGPVDPHANKLTILSLQRSSLGWRVVIPAAAIKYLGR
jgi:hypothetical protein